MVFLFVFCEWGVRRENVGVGDLACFSMRFLEVIWNDGGSLSDACCGEDVDA